MADNSCSDWITLDSSCDKTNVERVKYIPQSFLESLCVTEDDKQFEDEIKKIIFQHTPLTDRYGKNTLDKSRLMSKACGTRSAGLLLRLRKGANYRSRSAFFGRIRRLRPAHPPLRGDPAR